MKVAQWIVVLVVAVLAPHTANSEAETLNEFVPGGSGKDAIQIQQEPSVWERLTFVPNLEKRRVTVIVGKVSLTLKHRKDGAEFSLSIPIFEPPPYLRQDRDP